MFFSPISEIKLLVIKSNVLMPANWTIMANMNEEV